MTIAPAIILIIVAAIAGYVLGIVDSRITATLRKKNENELAPETNTPEPGSTEPERSGEHTVLKVAIDPALKWHVELDGNHLENPNAISQEQHQRMIDVIVQLRPWMDEKFIQPAPAIPVSSPATEPLPQKIATLSQPVIDKDPLKIDVMRGIRSILKNDIKAPGEQKGASIVSMIDEVLQVKLLNSPLIDSAIRLEEGSMGEVIVCVGSHRYNGIDSIPELEIREIIKAAIADWEKK